jgi:hypothetical protein
MQADHLGKAGLAEVMDRSTLKPSIELLTTHAAEHASLSLRHHHTATNRTPRGSRTAQNEKLFCSRPDGGSFRHALYSLVGSPSNVCSMPETRGASPWLSLGKFLDFLGGQEIETK